MITMHRQPQRGSILIITLILLLALTVIAISQITFNSTQTHIAANSSDSQIAFETAEGALNQATNSLFAGTYPTANFLSNANGLYFYSPSNPALWTTISWTDPTAVIMSFQGSSNAQAAYFIELLPSVVQSGQNNNLPTNVYRITARAVGASGSSPVILQRTVQMQ